MTTITLITLFMIKHFICDFPLQRWPYMYLNKGTYGHFGGILHAGIHFIGTFIILFYTGSINALIYAFIDSIVHYHTDLIKVKLCNFYNLKPDNSEWYWHLLGLDQLIHTLTYIGIIWALQ